MKKIAVAALSLMLACSLCPVASFASDAVLQDELAVSDALLEDEDLAGAPEDSDSASVDDAPASEGADGVEPMGGSPEGDTEEAEGDEAEGETDGGEAENESADGGETIAIAFTAADAEGDPQVRSVGYNVLYVDPSGNAYNCPEATEVTADDREWTTGWYVAAGEIAIPNRVDVNGEVNLILADGCTLNAEKGIGVYNDNAITIWASVQQTGALNAIGGGAGIGGDGAYESRVNAGAITINGGNIYAKGASACAGIGGGAWSNAYGATSGNAGTIVINGGAVTAEGSDSYMKAKPAAAIGGAGEAQGGSITITGGTVDAQGYGVAAAAIGGGSGGRVPAITITGGRVIAEGGASASSGNRGPGIGNSVYESSVVEGNAYIETNSLYARFKSGILNKNGQIEVNGNQTLPQDLTVEAEKTLLVYPTGTLTIPAGTTLSNNGRIRDLGTVVNHGSIVNDGALIVGSGGTISGVGSFSGNKGTQDAPAAPVAESVGEGSVTLAPIGTTGQGATEYACVEGDGTPSSWQTATTFTGLKDNTTYTFYARYAGDTYCAPAQSAGTAVTTKEFVSGHIENVTVAGDNYLGADFAMPADYFAENVLPDYALQQNARGKDVGIWMESARVTDGEVTTLVGQQLDGFLPIAYFGLTPYYQIDGEAPEALAAATRDDALVQIKLALPDSAVNTDPSIIREYKVICVYDGTSFAIPCSYNPDTRELTFRTNRFASFGLACKDTRDGEQVFPVMVRDSYASASGQGQYAAGEKVTIYAGERDGYAVEFWNAVTAQGRVSFTYQDADRAEFTMPDTPVVVSITWLRSGDDGNGGNGGASDGSGGSGSNGQGGAEGGSGSGENGTDADKAGSSGDNARGDDTRSSALAQASDALRSEAAILVLLASAATATYALSRRKTVLSRARHARR